MNTETLDKLYLEWSQFTKARTIREIKAINALKRIKASYGKVCQDFEICNHESCMSSYAAWAEADLTLKALDGE